MILIVMLLNLESIWSKNMPRKYLFEIIEECLLPKDETERKIAFENAMKKNRGFKDFIDFVYNPKYQYELSLEAIKYKVRNHTRENGGFPTSWMDGLKVIQNKLLKNTQSSPRFGSLYQHSMETANYKDAEILNHALRYRAIKGIKGKEFRKMFPEFLKQDDNE